MPDIDTIALWLVVCATTLWVWGCMRRNLVNHPFDNVPGPPARSFWTGNLGQYFDRHGHAFHKEIAQNYGPIVKLHGLFGRPFLHIQDPKALYTILLQEQNTYEEASSIVNAFHLLVGPGLVAVTGEPHRKQRKMLNPLFSINNMRNLLPVFNNTLDRLRNALISQCTEDQQDIDILRWLGRGALEIIGQGALGCSFDSLIDDTAVGYADTLKMCITTLQEVLILRPLLPYVMAVGPAWFRRRLVEMAPIAVVQKLKAIIDTMDRKSEEIFLAKKLSIQQGGDSVLHQVGKSKDLMTVLMKANLEAAERDRLSESEVIGQMSTIVLAATDTTAAAVSRICHLLAQHPEMQGRLRAEISSASMGRDLSYDNLMKLPLLDAVLRETLRLYPPGNFAEREAKKDTVLSFSKPIRGKDGRALNEIFIPKGTELYIGILGCNTDKDLWGDDALEWKPERWMSPLPNAVTNASIPGVYSNVMTFGGGQRACIGFKFAELASKSALAMLLPTFTFQLSDKPIEWNSAMVYYPTVGRESTKPEMPLKLGLVHGSNKSS